MKIKHGLLIAISLLLTACAEPQKFLGPNKNTAYFLDCSSMGLSLGACYKKAGELCPEGYAVINSTANTVGVPMTTGGTIITTSHGLAIECK
jgi:hypothetical protein